MSVNQNVKKQVKKSHESKDDLMSRESQDFKEAIKNSKQTAETEEKQRQSRQQAEEASESLSPPASSTNTEDFEESDTEKNISPKQRRKQPKSPTDNTSNLEVSPQNDVSFQDFIEAPESSLDIIYHPPVYTLPITTCPMSIQNVPLQRRFNVLNEYFSKLEALRSKTVKKSYRRAPWPKPICTTDDRPDLKTKSGIDKLFEHIPDQQVYVSRAGRQVKRKIYTEEIEEDSDNESQSSASTIKKNKADDSDIKITVSKPYIPPAGQEVGKCVSKIPRAKTESPKRVTPKKPTTRSDKVFNKLLENNEKKKLEEAESDNFQKTLPELGEAEEEMLQEEDSSQSSEECIVKKRVLPPVPPKRGEKTKRPSKEDTEKADSDSPPDRIKRYDAVGITRATQEKLRAKLMTTEVKETECPICSLHFLPTELEEHASTCGEVFPEPSGTSPSAVGSMTCQLCDRVFLSSKDYQIHVKACVATKVTEL